MSFSFDARTREELLPHYKQFKHHSQWWPIAKSFGGEGVALGAALALWLWHRSRWLGAALVLVGGVMSQAVVYPLKWMFGRSRPELLSLSPFDFHPFRSHVMDLLQEINLSLPSGHAAAAFALATTLALLIPRAALLWFLLALLCGAERVVTLAHWPSDVVLGAIVGVFSAWFSYWLLSRIGRSRWVSAPASTAD